MMQQLGLSLFSSALLVGLLMTSPVINAEQQTHDDHAHDVSKKEKNQHTDDHQHEHEDEHEVHHEHDHDTSKKEKSQHTDDPQHDHEDEHEHEAHHEHKDEHKHEHGEARTQHGTHEHGTAQLMISLSEQQLDIMLETPAANLLGFEHTPHTKEQNEHIVSIQKRLKQVSRLLTPASAAHCTLKAYKAESPLFAEKASNSESDTDIKANNATEDQHTTDKKTHTDILVTWQWQCSHMNKLDQVAVKLFSAFPQGFQRLNVEWISANKASAVRLTSDDTVMFK